jgi:undecaprenyl-diphosphatase
LDVVHQVGIKRAILIGCAQVIAIIPGTSRSGITITAGLAGGLDRITAAKFSFLLSIPTIAAAGFLKLGSVVRGEETIALLPLAIGFLVAMVSAFLTVRFLLTFLKRYSFSELAIFRVLVGIAILLLL